MTATDRGAYGEGDVRSVSAEVLREVHPLYQLTYHEWKRLVDLSEGLNLGNYIHRHPRESVEANAARRRRVLYRNFVNPVVDLTCSYIFSKPITRAATPEVSEDEGDSQGKPEPSGAYDMGSQVGTHPDVNPEEVERDWDFFLYDVDRKGGGIDRFMRHVLYWSQTFGMVDVLVDMPSTDEPIRSREEQQQKRMFPYFTCYFPTQRTNWEVDELGRLLWVRFEEPLTGTGKPYRQRDQKERTNALRSVQSTPLSSLLPIKSGNISIQRPVDAVYRTFTRTHWSVHTVEDGRVKDVKEGTHPCLAVPVVTFFNRRRALTPEIGLTAVGDIANVSETILNIDSLVDEALFQQCLNILVMKRQMAHKGDIVIGVDNVLEYTGDVPPNFLTPSTAPLAFMEQRIQDLKDEVKRLANFGGGDALQVRAQPSGVSQMVEFNETDRILGEKAENLQDGEYNLHAFVYRWCGSRFEGTIDYPDSFQVQALSTEMSELTGAGAVVRSDLFRRELEKRLVRRMLPNVPQPLIEAIETEIDVIPASAAAPPVWFDAVTQEIRNPGDPNAVKAIGVMGEILGSLPEDEQEEAGVPPREDPMQTAIANSRDPRQRMQSASARHRATA